MDVTMKWVLVDISWRRLMVGVCA